MSIPIKEPDQSPRPILVDSAIGSHELCPALNEPGHPPSNTPHTPSD
jgi:hypothetical protein